MNDYGTADGYKRGCKIGSQSKTSANVIVSSHLPHGEERALARVSNHEEDASDPSRRAPSGALLRMRIADEASISCPESARRSSRPEPAATPAWRPPSALACPDGQAQAPAWWGARHPASTRRVACPDRQEGVTIAAVASPAPSADCGQRSASTKDRIWQAPPRPTRTREAYPSCKRVFFRPETSRSPRITSRINGRRNALFPVAQCQLDFRAIFTGDLAPLD